MDSLSDNFDNDDYYDDSDDRGDIESDHEVTTDPDDNPNVDWEISRRLGK